MKQGEVIIYGYQGKIGKGAEMVLLGDGKARRERERGREGEREREIEIDR